VEGRRGEVPEWAVQAAVQGRLRVRLEPEMLRREEEVLKKIRGVTL